MISMASTCTILSALPPPCISLLLYFLTILIITSSAELIPSTEVYCRELASLKHLDGSSISFAKPSDHAAARDFGGLIHEYPCAVLYPKSVQDIAALVKLVYLSPINVTIAARGAGHSIYGQAQAAQGIVIEMSSLGSSIDVVVAADNEGGGDSFVDASGGALWIDVVKETLKKGVAPRSFTDYLHLSVGGTLSNAGISGQAFRYGPQISNVLQLQVVTGKGETVICSRSQKKDLFFSVLGGLGQFGIITKARIQLHRVLPMVKYIRAFYADFKTFTDDQEMLILQKSDYTFDYIEGSVLYKAQGPHGWTLESLEGKNLNISRAMIDTNASLLYCLELTINRFQQEEQNAVINKKMDYLLSRLHYLPSSIFIEDTSNLKFLDRVHDIEKQLQKLGLWKDIPHPWLNLFIPKSHIDNFDSWVLKKKLHRGINGPVLIYPLNRNKWDSRMSAVIPSEEIFYLVGLLGYPSLHSYPKTTFLITQNSEILQYCNNKAIGYKQYLPHYSHKNDWKSHFGNLWPRFARRKLRYDPKAILSPGQKLFSR